jgi:peptidyl-prolyl cis-trans isomerase C
VLSEAAADAIDQWLERHLSVPEPDEAACRRHAAHRARYAVGERVQVRHILFAVTPGTDVKALRLRAERP